MEPVRAPDTMNGPASRLEDFLAQAIAVTSRTRRMIRRPIAFHAENVPTRLSRIYYAKINVEAGHADLRMHHETAAAQELSNRLFEVAVKDLLRTCRNIEITLLRVLQEFAQRHRTGLPTGDVDVVCRDW